MASIFLRTLIIYITLTISMRLMGKREIGELEVGELVTSLLISEICSIPIDNPDIPLLNAIIPVLFIVSLEIIISAVKNKSKALKRAVDGHATFLIYKGKMRQGVLKENRISIEEFFSVMRQNGIGSLEEIEYCLIESNGKISIIKSDSKQKYSYLLISDGEVNAKNLSILGFDERWLRDKLKGASPREIFIFCYNDDGSTNIILKEGN